MAGNFRQVKNGGKGSDRRAGADNEAYASGWDRIFGERNNDRSKKDNTKENPNTESSDQRNE